MADDQDLWVVVEHNGEVVLDVTFEMLDDARKLADSLRQNVCALVLGGPTLPDFSQRLAEHGADHVYYVRHELLNTYQSEPFVQALTILCGEVRPATVILAASPNGQDLAARLSARLDVGLVSSCLQFTVGPDGNVHGVKGTYGGKVYSTLACSGKAPHLFTFIPGSVGVGPPDKRRKATVTECSSLSLQREDTLTRSLAFIPADPRTVDLTEADMIIGGGAGVGTKEMFGLIQQLADALGASVGGTRPAVDHGWIPHERQIGQTGKIIAPRLYIAAGISGAGLHSMGIKNSEHIVALNTDTSAPVFKLAQLSAVGDLTMVLPLLVDRIRKHREKQSRDTRTV